MNSTEKRCDEIFEVVSKHGPLSSAGIYEYCGYGVGGYLKLMADRKMLYRIPVIGNRDLGFIFKYIYFPHRPTWEELKKVLESGVSYPDKVYLEYMDLRNTRSTLEEKKFLILTILKHKECLPALYFENRMGFKAHDVLNLMVSDGEICRLERCFRGGRKSPRFYYFLKHPTEDQLRRYEKEGFEFYQVGEGSVVDPILKEKEEDVEEVQETQEEVAEESSNKSQQELEVDPGVSIFSRKPNFLKNRKEGGRSDGLRFMVLQRTSVAEDDFVDIDVTYKIPDFILEKDLWIIVEYLKNLKEQWLDEKHTFHVLVVYREATTV